MPILSIALDANDDALEALRCPCGSWSHLSFDPTEVRCDGIVITGPLPSLVCNKCGVPRLPHKVKAIMQDFAEEAKQKGNAVVRVDITAGATAKKRFPFCKNVTLKYDPLDYFFIPGLERASESGFLTPVFFSIDILPYFQNHPGYVVNIASDSYGTLYTKDGGYISFGLNRAKSLVMWLGDLDELSKRDLLMLAAHNIDSDHDIGSEFYDGQIEAIFTELSQERRIVRAQDAFAGELARKFGTLRFLKMEAEAVDLLANLRRPIYFTTDEFGNSMETMTKLFIERIDVEQLRNSVQSLLSPEESKAVKNYRELKLLQLWLGKCLRMNDPATTMMPLFVLYDLRVAFKHLLPDAKREELRLSSISRLGLDSHATLEELYVRLTESLERSFRDMAKSAAQASQIARSSS